MKNLKIWQKLMLLGAVFLVPFAIVTYKMASSINALGTEFARQEVRGLDYYLPLLTLLKDLQEHRGIANVWLNGDASFWGHSRSQDGRSRKGYRRRRRGGSAAGRGAANEREMDGPPRGFARPVERDRKLACGG